MSEVNVNVSVGRGNLEAYGVVRFKNSVQEKEFNELIQKIITTYPPNIKDLINNFGGKIKDEATLNSLRKLISNAIWKRYNTLNNTNAAINQADHNFISEQITRLRVALINVDTDLLKKVKENQSSTITTTPAEEAQQVGDKQVVIKGRKFVLMVGINDYINPAINDLGCCENDINGMKECLGDKWKNAKVTKLYGATDPAGKPIPQEKRATKENIRKWFLSLKNQLKPGDEVLFVYSGHGSNDGNDGYLIPVNANISDTNTLISGKELAIWRSLLGGATTAFVIDSCFSGEIPDDFTAYKAVKKKKYSRKKFVAIKSSKRGFNKNNEFYKKLASGNYKGIKSATPTIIATASRADQVSEEDPEMIIDGLGKGFGAFIGWLIQGLGIGNKIGPADTNDDKGISLAGEAFNYASSNVALYYNQRPQIFFSGTQDGDEYNWSIKGANEKRNKPAPKTSDEPVRDPEYVQIEQASKSKKAGDASKPAGNGKVFVLSIGVNKYDEQGYEAKYGEAPKKLDWCVKDANDVAKAFQSPVCPPENVTVLTDEQATWANVQQSVEAIKKKMGPDDKLIIYSSSHGTNDGEEGYILLHDTMVSGTQLGDLRDKAGENEVALIFDSCQNGALIGKGADINVVVGKDAKYFKYNRSKDDFTKAQNSMVKKCLRPNSFVFTSCRGDEYSVEDSQLQNGVFTYALLQILTEKRTDGSYHADYNKDSNISMEEIVGGTLVRTKLLTREKETGRASQHPQFLDNNLKSRFVVKASE